MDTSLQAADIFDAPRPLVPPPPDLWTQAAILLDGAPAAPLEASTTVKLKKQHKKKHWQRQRQQKNSKDSEISNQHVTLANLITQRDYAIKVALDADIKESDPDFSSRCQLSCYDQHGQEQPLSYGGSVEQDTKASFPELLKNEKLSDIALVSAALAFHRAKINQKEFWKVFWINMLPIVSSMNLHNKMDKAGEFAMKLAFEEHLGKLLPGLLDPAKGFLVLANMADDRLSKVGEIVKTNMKKFFREHLEKEKLSNLALMSAGLAYECSKNDHLNF